jgi:hypothetical protein
MYHHVLCFSNQPAGSERLVSNQPAGLERLAPQTSHLEAARRRLQYARVGRVVHATAAVVVVAATAVVFAPPQLVELLVFPAHARCLHSIINEVHSLHQQ